MGRPRKNVNAEEEELPPEDLGQEEGDPDPVDAGKTLLSWVGRLVSIETVEGGSISGKLTAINWREIRLGQDTALLPQALVLDSDATFAHPLANLTRVSVKGN